MFFFQATYRFFYRKCFCLFDHP